MPFVNQEAFEEVRRHQQITKYEIYPLQSEDVEDYQVLTEDIPSLLSEDVRILQKKAKIPFWVEEKAKVWSKIAKLMSKTPQLLFALSGNPSTSLGEDGDDTFEFFDDFESEESWLTPQLVSSNIILTDDRVFGALLFDKDGHIIIDGDSKTWLYWIPTYAGDENNTTRARKIHVDTLVTDVGTDVEVKGKDTGYQWACGHIALKIADSFYLLFYTAYPDTGDRRLRVAKCSTPNGTFTRLTGFEVAPSEAWEGDRLEVDCGIIKISEDATNIDYWILIYGGGAGTQKTGWIKVRVNKTTEIVTYIERYANNPLTNLQISGGAYLGGGNIDESFKIDGKYVLYYNANYSATFNLARALSSDKMFHTVDEKESFGTVSNCHPPEKYQYYRRGDYLYLFFECLGTPKRAICNKYKAGCLGKWGVSHSDGGSCSVTDGILKFEITAANNKLYVLKALTPNFGVDHSIRFRERREDRTNNWYTYAGMHNTELFTTAGGDSLAVMNHEMTERLRTRDEGTQTETTSAYDSAAWHINELKWKSGEIKWYVNNTLKATHTTNIPNDNDLRPSVSIRTFNSANPGSPKWSEYDWIIVRKYASPEPLMLQKQISGKADAIRAILHG